jgi:large repetitive protein
LAARRVVTNPFGERTTLLYDTLNRENGRILFNGMRTSHTYDAISQETVLEHFASDSTPLARFSTSYDPVGNPLVVTELDGSVTSFGYDAMSRITTEIRSDVTTPLNSYTMLYAWDAAASKPVKERKKPNKKTSE